MAGPTWGYRKGEGKVFELNPGETLPEGWTEIPHLGDHPNVPKHVAEALIALEAAEAKRAQAKEDLDKAVEEENIVTLPEVTDPGPPKPERQWKKMKL
jgi:hypothetical protein